MAETSAQNKKAKPGRSRAPEPKAEIESESLYAKHKKVYPREVHGIFANLRLLGVVVLLGLYYLAPWVQLGGRQALLFDLPERKFYVFAWTFWPQDFFYLALQSMQSPRPAWRCSKVFLREPRGSPRNSS